MSLQTPTIINPSKKEELCWWSPSHLQLTLTEESDKRSRKTRRQELKKQLLGQSISQRIQHDSNAYSLFMTSMEKAFQDNGSISLAVAVVLQYIQKLVLKQESLRSWTIKIQRAPSPYSEALSAAMSFLNTWGHCLILANNSLTAGPGACWLFAAASAHDFNSTLLRHQAQQCDLEDRMVHGRYKHDFIGYQTPPEERFNCAFWRRSSYVTRNPFDRIWACAKIIHSTQMVEVMAYNYDVDNDEQLRAHMVTLEDMEKVIGLYSRGIDEFRHCRFDISIDVSCLHLNRIVCLIVSSLYVASAWLIR
jgi:hypothetical protein